MHAAVQSEVLCQAAQAGAVLDHITIQPWVVCAGYMVDDDAAPSGWRYEQAVHIVWATYAQAPEPEAFAPAAATFARGEIFPVSRFDDMAPAVRSSYLPQYRAWLMARKARALGKPVAELQPWVDYDAVHVDESVQRWAAGSGALAFGG